MIATKAAPVQPVFDSAAVDRSHLRFGRGLFVGRTRRFEPTPEMERERLALIAADAEREFEDRFLAYEFEDRAAGRITDADVATATGCC